MIVQEWLPLPFDRAPIVVFLAIARKPVGPKILSGLADRSNLGHTIAPMRIPLLAFTGILVASVLVFLDSSATAESPVKWQKIDQQDGIVAYSRDVPGSAILAFRGDGDIAAPIAKVASILIDIERGPEWIDSLIDAHPVRRVSEVEYVEYDHFGTPFPLAHRDFVFAAKLELVPQSKQIVLRFHSVDDPQAPKTGYVRGELIQSSFTLTSLDHGTRTHMMADIQTDPKGWIPAFIVNMVQRSWPVSTLASLRKQARKANVTENARLKQALVDAGYYQ